MPFGIGAGGGIMFAMEQMRRRRRGQPPLPRYFQRGEAGLLGTTQELLYPEIGYQQGIRKRVTDPFLRQASTPGALFGAASTAAEGMARELFRPGGVVGQGIASARRGSVQQGFEPMAAEGAELGVLGQATDQVANAFAQNAAALEQQRFGAFANFASQAQGGPAQAIANYMTGQANVEQFGLARRGSQRRGGLLGLGIGPL